MSAGEHGVRTSDQNKRAQVAYHMAYFVLPPRAHNDIKELRADFDNGLDLAALSYYRQAAKSHGLAPHPDELLALRAHTADVGQCDVIVIEYPRFPAVDLLTEPVIGSHVLAPYFSAVLENRMSTEVQYFVLGQSLDAGTTLRSVSPELNANLGRGCKPQLAAFLKLLRRYSHE